MLTRATTFSVITTGFVLFCSVAAVRAQTAACCVGDACQVLDRQACRDQHGYWFGTLATPILDCAGAPCTTGACCLEDLVCVGDRTMGTCVHDDGVYYPLSSCSLVQCTLAPNDDCEDAETICTRTCVHPTDPTLSTHMDCVTDDQCSYLEICEDFKPSVDNGYCLLNLGTDTICSISAQDCYNGSPCGSWVSDAYRCRVPTDNRLATTDGPPQNTFDSCWDSGEDSFQADVWYIITAPCRGEMVIEMCTAPHHYDSMLAVFGRHEAIPPPCPGASNDDLLVCRDDGCEGVPTRLETFVYEDGVYIIRLGGWSNDGTLEWADQHISELDIGFLCARPPPPCGPGGWELPPEIEHHAPKSRYITMNTSAFGSNVVAFEVTLIEMNRCSGDTRRACVVDDDCPGVCSDNNDIQCSTDAVCTANGAGTCVPSRPCGPHADVGAVVGYISEPFTRSCFPNDDCAGEFFANVVDTPVYRVWTEETVHVTGCEIVPAAGYEIVTFDQISGVGVCPVTIGTVPKPAYLQYGDVVGIVTDGQFTPPNGCTCVTDLQAFLISNQGGSGTTGPAHTTWVDLHGDAAEICETPNIACTVPQAILNVSDLNRIKFGFIGRTYVATPGQVDPGDCP